MTFGLFESALSSDQEVGLARQAAVDKRQAAIYDVREKLGPSLFASRDLQEFRDRVAMMKNDQSVYKIIGEHIHPSTGVVRSIVGRNGALEKEFKARRETLRLAGYLDEIIPQSDEDEDEGVYNEHGTKVKKHHKDSGLYKGAPFAGYKDFDACVAANSDKRNPQAYCGKIKHQVEGRLGAPVGALPEAPAPLPQTTDPGDWLGDVVANPTGGNDPGGGRRASFDGTVSTKSTFHPSSGKLVPKDNWEGYKGSVDQGAAGKVKRNFRSSRVAWTLYNDWCAASGLHPTKLSSLDAYAGNLTDEQYFKLAQMIQACDENMTEHKPKTPSGQSKSKLRDVTAAGVQAPGIWSQPPGGATMSDAGGNVQRADDISTGVLSPGENYNPTNPSNRRGSRDPLHSYLAWTDANGFKRISARNVQIFAGNDPELCYHLAQRMRRAVRVARQRQGADIGSPGSVAPTSQYNQGVAAEGIVPGPLPNAQAVPNSDVMAQGQTGTGNMGQSPTTPTRGAGRQGGRHGPYGSDDDADYWGTRVADPPELVRGDPDYGPPSTSVKSELFRPSRHRKPQHAGSRRYAQPDYLQKADDALTQLLNQKAEEFQQTIAPLQQALVTVQQAEQLAQAQNPLNVLPPPGTVNVMPGGDQGEAGMPSSDSQDLGAAAQALAGPLGGAPPGGGGPGGPPPGGPPGGGAPPPDPSQMMQASRRRYAYEDEYDDYGPPHSLDYDPSTHPVDQSKRRHVPPAPHDPARRAMRGGQGKGSAVYRPRQAASVFDLWHKWQSGRGQQGNLPMGGEPDYQNFAQEMGVGSRGIQKLRQHHQQGITSSRQRYLAWCRRNRLRAASTRNFYWYLGQRPHEAALLTGGSHDFDPSNPEQIFAPARGHGWEHSSGPSGRPYERPQGKGKHEHGGYHEALEEGMQWAGGRSGYRQGGNAGSDEGFESPSTLTNKQKKGIGSGNYGQAEKGVKTNSGDGSDASGNNPRHKKQSHRKQAWSGWGPALFPKTRQVTGWDWSNHLNGYLANQPQRFACECGDSFGTPSGFHRCGCGKQWNSYVIGTGGNNHEASADKFLVREIPVRDDVIVANRQLVGASFDREHEIAPGVGKHDYQSDFNERARQIGQQFEPTTWHDFADAHGTKMRGVPEHLRDEDAEMMLSHDHPTPELADRPRRPHLDPDTGKPAEPGSRWGALHRVTDPGEMYPEEGEDDEMPTFRRPPPDWHNRGDGARWLRSPIGG